MGVSKLWILSMVYRFGEDGVITSVMRCLLGKESRFLFVDIPEVLLGMT